MNAVWPRDAENPFKRDKDGNIPNPSAIGKLIRTDFDRALQLCREAGEPVTSWFDLNPR